MSYIGDHVWLITSRQTDPDLNEEPINIQIIHFHEEKVVVGGSQFVNVRVEDSVYKSNAGTLVRVLVGQFNVDLPMATGEGSCRFIS